MADGVMNIALGRINEYVNRVASNDPANSAIVIVLLKAAESDATLKDYDDLGTLLAAAGNTEADFTNYGPRKTLVDTDLSNPTPDDTADDQEAVLGDITWTSAGGTTDNTLVKLLVCYDSDTTAGTDSNIIVLTHHDFAVTTDGNDLTADEPAGGFFGAS